MATVAGQDEVSAHGHTDGAALPTNALPFYDDSVNTTGCCAKFNPEGWDGRRLHFEDKRFLRATTKSAMHVPLNMGRVMERVQTAIAAADAQDPHENVMLSHDPSFWTSEHLIAVTKDVPGEEMTTLSGDFVTRVFEGPFSSIGTWQSEMEAEARKAGSEAKKVYFFYTTCPKCAKAYGKNYVVGVAQI